MLLATALALLIYVTPTRRLLFKTNRSSSTKAKPSPIIFLVSEIGRRKNVDAAKICGGAENVVKNRNPANTKWIARFITLGILYPLKRIAQVNICMMPIDMGNSICTAH